MAADSLGREVVRRAQDNARLSQRRAGVLVDAGHLGDAEVQDLGPERPTVLGAREDDVVRLEIPVHDPTRMSRRDASSDAEHHTHAIFGRQQIVGDRLPQRLAVQVLHDQIRSVVPRPDIVDVDHVGVVHGTGRLGLATEPRGGVGLLRLRRQQELHRDALARQQVLGREDRAHPPLTQLPLDEVLLVDELAKRRQARGLGGRGCGHFRPEP